MEGDCETERRGEWVQEEAEKETQRQRGEKC